jgi:uridine kinase
VSNLNDIVKTITQNGRGKQLIVFVCGFGGAGKTTFCRRLCAEISCPAIVFETDWFAKYPTEQRRERIRSAVASQNQELIEQEENPINWYDWPALVSDLKKLKESGRLEIRNGWSQRTGRKDFSIDLEIPTEGDSVIICDGIYLLHDAVKSAADLIVFLDTQVATCLNRSAARDSHRSTKEYLDYKALLVDKYDKPYFELYSSNADMYVNVDGIISRPAL